MIASIQFTYLQEQNVELKGFSLFSLVLDQKPQDQDIIHTKV